jgi:isopenicillin N synthase-like dioxygenase
LDGGFFYVINHGIRQELFEELFDRSRTFFQLPLEEKMKALKNENFRGYTPLMDQMLDPSKQTKGRLSRLLLLCLELSEF